jgi:hypothetical protein
MTDERRWSFVIYAGLDSEVSLVDSILLEFYDFDIVLVSNKVPTMQFDVEYYRRQSFEQANMFQHSTLQLFGSIHMANIYPRFESAFKGASHDNVPTIKSWSKRTPIVTSSITMDTSAFDTELPTEKEEGTETSNEQQVQQQDERRTAQHFNFVSLPYDSTITPGVTPLAKSAATEKHNSSSGHKLSSSMAGATLSPASGLLQSAMSHLSISLQCYNVLGASLKQPYHDVFGAVLQDQERWKVWTKGLRNKVLSLSMRPQGGPALGPRNRPGMVSEREW